MKITKYNVLSKEVLLFVSSELNKMNRLCTITQPCGIPINIPVYNDWINNIDIALREYIITEEDLKKDVNVLKLFTSEYYDGRQCPCKFVISAGKQLYKTITNKE